MWPGPIVDSNNLVKVLTQGPRITGKALQIQGPKRPKGPRDLRVFNRLDDAANTEENLNQLIALTTKQRLENLRRSIIVPYPSSRDTGKKSGGLVSVVDSKSSHQNQDDELDFGDYFQQEMGPGTSDKKNSSDLMFLMMSKPGEMEFEGDPLRNLESDSKSSEHWGFTQELVEHYRHFMEMDEKEKIAELEAIYKAEEPSESNEPRNQRGSRQNQEARRSKKVRTDSNAITSHIATETIVRAITEKLSVTRLHNGEEKRHLVKPGLDYEKSDLIESKALEDFMESLCSSELDGSIAENMLKFKELDGKRAEGLGDMMVPGRGIIPRVIEGSEPRDHEFIVNDSMSIGERSKSIEETPLRQPEMVPEDFFEIGPVENHLETIAEEESELMTKTSNETSSIPMDFSVPLLPESFLEQRGLIDQSKKKLKEDFDAKLKGKQSFSFNHYLETEGTGSNLEIVCFLASALESAQAGKIRMSQAQTSISECSEGTRPKEVFIEKTRR